MTESFGARLRRERERQRISIKSIAAATNIRAAFFEQLERGDASKWPSGIFRRSFIRAYASAIGLDPDATVREFLEAFPDPAQPPPEQEAKTAKTRTTAAVRPTELRLQLAVGGVGPQRCLATCFDAASLAAMAVAAFILFGQVWMPLGIAMLAYYLGGTILTGATPGVFFLDWCRRRGRTKAARVPSASPFLVHPERGHSLSLELSTHSGVVSNQ